MIYILYGEQELMIKNRIKKIIRDEAGDNADIININCEEHPIGLIIDEYDQFSLTGDKKVVICENPYFFETTPKNKHFNKKELKELIECLKVENSNVLIFVLYQDKINQKSDIFKLAKESGQIFEFKTISKNDWLVYIKKYFNDRNVTIEDEAVSELANRIQDDLRIFKNESSKLLMYKGNNITLDDVKEITARPLENDVFKISNSLIAGNKEEAIKTFRDLRVQGIEVVTLISLLSNSLLFMQNVKNLMDSGYSIDEISKITGSSTGRIYMTNKNLRNIKIDRIVLALEKLYELDHDIKHSKIDRFYGFELFLTNF